MGTLGVLKRKPFADSLGALGKGVSRPLNDLFADGSVSVDGDVNAVADCGGCVGSGEMDGDEAVDSVEAGGDDGRGALKCGANY